MVKTRKANGYLDLMLLLLFPGLVLFIFCIGIYIAYVNLADSYEGVTFENPELQDNWEQSSEIIISTSPKFATYFDWLLPLITLILWLFIWVVLYIVRPNLLFGFFFVVVALLLLMLSLYIGNATEAVLGAEGFAPYIADFPITTAMVNNYFLIAMIFILGGFGLYIVKPGEAA